MPSTRMLRFVNQLTANKLTGLQIDVFLQQQGVWGELMRLRTHTSLYRRLYANANIVPALRDSEILRNWLLSDTTALNGIFNTSESFATFVSTTEGEAILFNHTELLQRMCSSTPWAFAVMNGGLTRRAALHASDIALTAFGAQATSLAALRALPGYGVMSFAMTNVTSTQNAGLTTNRRGGIILSLSPSSTSGSTTGLEFQATAYRSDFTGLTTIPTSAMTAGTNGETTTTMIPMGTSTTLQLRHTVGSARTYYFGILNVSTTSA